MSTKNPREKFAHNIYSNPVLRETSGCFDGFFIDFRGVQTPVATYWALCNWGMDLTTFKNEHPDARGGGAYAGLQHTCNGKTAIMAFWETLYDNDTKRHNAKRIYPAGDDSAFGGEGEGTNFITPFPWEDNTWYRMVLRSWTDAENGTTFVGQWVQNRESGEWSLISYFDTRLVDSYIKGGMSQFQENYWEADSEPIRSFNLKNIFVKDCRDGWKYIPRTTLCIDDPAWGFRTAGTHEFGATTEYYYGSAGGDVDDPVSYDAERPITGLFALPGKGELYTVEENSTMLDSSVEVTGETARITLVTRPGAAPILGVEVEVLDDSGAVIATVAQTRPEKTTVDVPRGDGYHLTVTNLYGVKIDWELQ